MSYYNPVVTAGPRRRPSAVASAGYLLYAVAAMAVIAAILTFAQVGTIGNAARDSAKAGEDPDTAATGAQFGIVGIAVIAVLAGAVFAVCAYYVMNGRNGMRVTTWVLGGLFALCLGCSAIGNGAGAAIGTTASTTEGTSSSTQSIANSFPAWYQVSTATLEGLSVLALLVVIVLLALPVSNAYFRKVDPMMGMMYAAPAYPPVYPAGGGGYQQYQPPSPYQPPVPPPVGGQVPNAPGQVRQDPPTAADPNNWPRT